MDRVKSLENRDLPTISAFPKDENYWRIDWFGEVQFPDRHLRRNQPSVLVYLSKVVDLSFTLYPDVLLSPSLTASPKLQRKVWVSIGTILLLRIGDIWREQKPVSRPAYQEVSVENLLIDSSTARVVKAGSAAEDGSFFIPTREHPWHAQCTQSYCVVVELEEENQRLIVPCMELVRFYFGSSSNFLSKLFLPPLQRKSLYENVRHHAESCRLVLDLAQGISGASASDVGRLCLDPVAWRAASRIGASMLRASLSKDSIFPQTMFPFEGRTTIAAEGMWLTARTDEKTTFLVFNLRSCTHPFPFKSLRYKMHGRTRRSPLNSEMSAGAKDQVRKVARDSQSASFVEHDGTGYLKPRERFVLSNVRFPDLQEKPVWKSRELAATNGAHALVSSPAVDQETVSESGVGGMIRPIDLAIAVKVEGTSRRAPPLFLRQTTEELKRLTEIDVELLTDSADDGWSVPLSVFSNDDGEIDVKLFAANEQGVLRLRRASVFALKKGREHVSIVFVEAEPLFMKTYTTTGMREDEIHEVLRCTSADFIFRPDGEGPFTSEYATWLFSDE